MSILLEALRKSEKNQRKNEVPTIHSDSQPGSVSGLFRIGPLVWIIIAALLIGGWFIWRQYQEGDDVYQPPVTAEPDGVPAVADQQDSSRPGAGEVPDTPPASLAADSAMVQARTPVESYKDAGRSAPGSGSGNTQASINSDSANRTASSTSPNRVAGNDPSPGSGSNQDAPGTSGSGEPAAVAKPEDTPHVPDPIGYWELPDAIRAEVPEIRFSVLVYANSPDDRFVLINGQRLGEGDTIEAGLVVEEIRRDDVVLSYRLYQFLVER